MARTGNIIVTERDTNPFSQTYDTTRTRTYQDYSRCLPDGYKWYYVYRELDMYNQEYGDLISGYVECDNNPTIIRDDTRFAYNSRSQSLTFRELAFGSCLTSIGERAFVNLYRMNTPLYIPSNITTIGEDAFGGCEAEIVEIHSETIETAAFIWSEGIQYLTLGSEVAYIGSAAFWRSIHLQSITCLATTPPVLRYSADRPEGAFADTNNCPIYVPAASVSAYQAAWPVYASRIQAIPS